MGTAGPVGRCPPARGSITLGFACEREGPGLRPVRVSSPEAAGGQHGLVSGRPPITETHRVGHSLLSPKVGLVPQPASQGARRILFLSCELQSQISSLLSTASTPRCKRADPGKPRRKLSWSVAWDRSPSRARCVGHGEKTWPGSVPPKSAGAAALKLTAWANARPEERTLAKEIHIGSGCQRNNSCCSGLPV